MVRHFKYHTETEQKPEINISYGDVIKILENKNIKNPTIKDVSNAIISIRKLDT